MSIVFDDNFRIVVDDVSDGNGSEFRASIYDSILDLISEAWGASVSEAIGFAVAELTKED